MQQQELKQAELFFNGLINRKNVLMEAKTQICTANYIAVVILEEMLAISAPSQQQIDLVEMLVSMALTKKECATYRKKLDRLMSKAQPAAFQ